MNCSPYVTYLKVFLFFIFATLVPDVSCSVFAATALTNNVPVAISLSEGREQFYSIQVPSAATKLQVTLSGGSGDLDLYTRYNAQPTRDSYDCRPYIAGNDETCSHTAPASGTWYILVRGYISGNSTLTATYEGGGSGSVTALANGASLPISLSQHEEKFYSIQVPSGATKLKVMLSGGNGDLDLYTRYNTRPDTDAYDCRPYQGGNNETCTHNNPARGTWYFMVRGYSAGNSTLTATYVTGGGSGSVTALTNGASIPVSLSQHEKKFYSIQVPANASELTVNLSGMTGDLDLYTRYNARPDTTNYACRPYSGTGMSETCRHTDPSSGTWYIMVQGFTSGSATLTATYTTGGTTTPTDSGELPAAKMVWSCWYWPMKDSVNPNLYDNNEALHRYDQYTGNSDAKGWEYNHHGPPLKPAGWWGHCHAWAAAACWEDQPTQAKTLGGVTFRIRDRKGLITEAYYKCANGSSYELYQNDPSPGLFWQYLKNEIGGANPIHGEPIGFIGELYYGDQVWNHPIYAYEVEYTGSGTVSGKITIHYAVDFEPVMADSTALHADTLTYYFKNVVLSGTTPTNSGTWVLQNGSLPSPTAYNYSRHRPDAIWRPYKASSWTRYAENPYLNNQALINILGQ